MAIVTKEKASRKAREMFEKGFSAMDRDNLDYAMDMFQQVLDIEPGFYEARQYLRAAQLRKFKAGGSAAVAHMMSALTGWPGVLSVRSKIKKKPMEALKAAELLMRKDPLQPSFVYALCDAAEALGMTEVSVQCLEMLRDSKPNDVPILRRLADAYMGSGQLPKAREVYDRLMQMKPNDQELIKAYKDTSALATMQEGGWGEEGSFRDKMKDSKAAITLEQEGKAVKTSADIEALIVETRRKLETEPDNVNYTRTLADLYVKSGKLQDALDLLDRASKATGGGDPQIDRTISTIKLLVIDNDIKGLEELGDTAGVEAKKQARHDFLLEDARQRVQRYPNDRDFKYELGELLFKDGELDEAIQQFQAAQRNPKRRIHSLYFLGLCFKQKNLWDIAREQLETAAGEIPIMDGMKKDIFYELGQILEKMDKKSEATAYFKEIYAVDIGYKDVAKKIEQSYGEA